MTEIEGPLMKNLCTLAKFCKSYDIHYIKYCTIICTGITRAIQKMYRTETNFRTLQYRTYCRLKKSKIPFFFSPKYASSKGFWRCVLFSLCVCAYVFYILYSKFIVFGVYSVYTAVGVYGTFFFHIRGRFYSRVW